MHERTIFVLDISLLLSRAKTVCSCILYEFYMRVKGVQASEPGKHEGCAKEHVEKPCPMGERDGLSLFVQSRPIEDALSLSLLERKSRKKEKRVHRALPYDSGETIWRVRTRPI